jgi:hypothetical protein
MSSVLFHGDLGVLFTALHAAQKEIAGFSKDSKNPHFKSDYASIESVIKAVKPALINNGLVVMQSIGPVIDGNASLTTTIAHTSGAYMQSTGEISKGRAKGPQDDGSANAYLRRYALVSLLLLKEADDDGNIGQHGSEEDNFKKAVAPKDGPSSFDEAVVLAGYDLGLLADFFESQGWPHWNTYKPEKMKDFPQFLDSTHLKEKFEEYTVWLGAPGDNERN